MTEAWVAVAAAPVPGAAWERTCGRVRIAGGPAGPSTGAVRRRVVPPARTGLAALLSCGAPAELRLRGIDALAAEPALAAALSGLPASVRTVDVDGVRFALDRPAERAGWRLVLAGLAAHAQSRSTTGRPVTGTPAAASAQTVAQSTGAGPSPPGPPAPAPSRTGPGGSQAR